MRIHFSKIGFILVVAGSAVGLGNAWKFPTLAAKNGGFSFVLLYLLLTLTLGLSVFLAEIAMGRLSRKDLAHSFESLAVRGAKYWKFGGIFMISGVFVLSFYLVIMGWVLKYMFFSLFYLPKDITWAKADFDMLLSQDLTLSFLCFFVSFILTFAVLARGLIKGIEKLNVIIMPSLFLMLLAMLLYCTQFEGFKQAFLHLFSPNLKVFSFDSLLDALGLAFFTLCLGIGCIVTYAAALPKKVNLLQSSIFVVCINLFIALMMGLIVFTFIFEFGSDPSVQGAGLVFVSLMSLFNQLGVFGNFLAFYFFLALFFAGITSAVSMVEPLIFYLTRTFKISRLKALMMSAFVVFVLSIACILSFNASFSAYLKVFELSFFDLLDKLTSNFLLPLGVFCISIFVGFFVKTSQIYRLFSSFMSRKMFKFWFFVLRFITPFAIIFISFYNFFV
ncbi:sodium-dependent transporter [Campylobacter sp. MIT 12-8780]|uniref:sodium-dependent transporter n=1 Tax=unclassified Campylobacter TaxID=2593542 RepID=UPI00115EF0B9|nr:MULTISPECIES: sodium-dependent transporter [unclassified Campylobacter]NDJ27015.1 sodium-dependent transporter [Campylobacter sp. MIT 19-121]TQR41848.1 sodium-dependent transporter [Campylobacter sp. MIT 12-8780]